MLDVLIPPSKNLDPTLPTAIRPPLRWAGSKRRMLSVLLNSLPSGFTSYCEPFVGSASLFFAVRPVEAYLNDLNSELINFYKVLTANPEVLYSALARFPRTKDSYTEVREKFHTTNDKVRRAAYFFFLNRNCFNGIYRTNRAGLFNVPFSNERTGKYPSLTNVCAAADHLRSCASITSFDFETFIKRRAHRGAFFYIDPPYYMPRKRIFSEYQRYAFDSDDVERLFDLLVFLDRSKCTFLLSYPDCSLARKLKAKWSVKSTSVRRSVAGKLKHRKIQRELLVSNY